MSQEYLSGKLNKLW